MQQPGRPPTKNFTAIRDCTPNRPLKAICWLRSPDQQINKLLEDFSSLTSPLAPKCRNTGRGTVRGLNSELNLDRDFMFIRRSKLLRFSRRPFCEQVVRSLILFIFVYKP